MLYSFKRDVRLELKFIGKNGMFYRNEGNSKTATGRKQQSGRKYVRTLLYIYLFRLRTLEYICFIFTTVRYLNTSVWTCNNRKQVYSLVNLELDLF